MGSVSSDIVHVDLWVRYPLLKHLASHWIDVCYNAGHELDQVRGPAVSREKNSFSRGNVVHSGRDRRNRLWRKENMDAFKSEIFV